jgi:uncharacterized protein (TIGR02147 family)
MRTAKRIYDSLDYRAFLAGFIEARKQENASYSMRAFASRASLNPGFLHRAIAGERNLAPAHMLALGKALKFTKKEQRYFELLVGYNQAKRQVERDHYFEQMHQFRKTVVKQVSVEQYGLYTHWYYLVIREILSILPCKDDSEECFKKIGQTLDPPIMPSEVRLAIETLKKLGVIERHKNGTLKSAASLTASGNEVPQVIVNRFFLEFTDLARRAIDSQPRTARRLSSLTFSASAKGFQKICERIDEFRSELMGMIESDRDRLSRVYHLNFQLFPVTRECGEEHI